ncbi:MAG: hypothetical protein JWR61_380 [Ferruginibacter sp.]|jgi:hypothetical protein|nr:hypothetical protein [Ferruginibacter sp.]
MKFIHFNYFCLYNFFYKDGYNFIEKDSFGLHEKVYYRALNTEQRPIFLFSLSLWFWSAAIRLLLALFFNLSAGQFFLSDEGFIIVPIIWAIGHFYFVDNLRYLRIYAEYRDTDKEIQRLQLKRIVIFSVIPVVVILFIFLSNPSAYGWGSAIRGNKS